MTPEHLRATTFHKRFGGPENAFRYGVDYVLVEPESSGSLPALFSRNRFNLAAIHDRDHGGTRGDGRGAAWVRAVLRDRGLEALAGMRVLLLAQPRVLGHWFNPVCFWLVMDDTDELRAVIAEVNNTYGDRHSYLCCHEDLSPIGPDDRLTAEKIFHVSPFLPVEGTYSFTFDITPRRIDIRIELRRVEGRAIGFVATLGGARAPLTSPGILKACLARPLGSLRVLALIYAQAFRLHRKGAIFRDRPAPPAAEVSQ